MDHCGALRQDLPKDDDQYGHDRDHTDQRPLPEGLEHEPGRQGAGRDVDDVVHDETDGQGLLNVVYKPLKEGP